MMGTSIQAKTQPALVVEFEGHCRAYPLRAGILTVGRAEDVDICILHGQISRQQAVIRPQGQDQFLLLDGDGQGKPSRNGTFVNWEPVRHKLLEQGDVICFGSPAAVAHFVWLDESTLRQQDQLNSIKEQITAGLTAPFQDGDD